MNDIKQTVAWNISTLRTKRGMTQLELAEKLNYTDKAISKWERAESIPDVTVLKEIAELFGVTVDYLLTEDHTASEAMTEDEQESPHLKNKKLITCMSILAVWLVATFVYVFFDLITPGTPQLSFICAMPVSAVVWLIFNSVWFNQHRNYLIVSVLMWSILLAVHLSFLVFDRNIWMIYFLGIPAQVIILFWSKIRFHRRGK